MAEEPIVRLILDGTVVRVRLDKKATSISLLVALGVRTGRSEGAVWPRKTWAEKARRLGGRCSTISPSGALKTPDLVIVDGGSGLDAALAALWSDVPVQRCTVHKHRNLLAHAPERLHEELSNDYRDMIYAETAKEVETRRKAFLRKWRLKCPAVATSLEEAGDRLFTFTRFPQSQWKSIRTSNAIERLHERSSSGGSRPKPSCQPPKPQPCCSGHSWRPARSPCGRSTAGKTLAEQPSDQVIDLAA